MSKGQGLTGTVPTPYAPTNSRIAMKYSLIPRYSRSLCPAPGMVRMRFCSEAEAFVHLPRLLHRGQGVHFPVDYQGRHADGRHLGPVAGFQLLGDHRVHPVAEIAQDGPAAFDNDSLQCPRRIVGRQIQRRRGAPWTFPSRTGRRCSRRPPGCWPPRPAPYGRRPAWYRSWASPRCCRSPGSRPRKS